MEKISRTDSKWNYSNTNTNNSNTNNNIINGIELNGSEFALRVAVCDLVQRLKNSEAKCRYLENHRNEFLNECVKLRELNNLLMKQITLQQQHHQQQQQTSIALSTAASLTTSSMFNSTLTASNQYYTVPLMNKNSSFINNKNLNDGLMVNSCLKILNSKNKFDEKLIIDENMENKQHLIKQQHQQQSKDELLDNENVDEIVARLIKEVQSLKTSSSQTQLNELNFRNKYNDYETQVQRIAMSNENQTDTSIEQTTATINRLPMTTTTTSTATTTSASTGHTAIVITTEATSGHTATMTTTTATTAKCGNGVKSVIKIDGSNVEAKDFLQIIDTTTSANKKSDKWILQQQEKFISENNEHASTHHQQHHQNHPHQQQQDYADIDEKTMRGHDTCDDVENSYKKEIAVLFTDVLRNINLNQNNFIKMVNRQNEKLKSKQMRIKSKQLRNYFCSQLNSSVIGNNNSGTNNNNGNGGANNMGQNNYNLSTSEQN